MGTMLPTILELERQKKEIKSSKNMSLRGEEAKQVLKKSIRSDVVILNS